jgi:hypothetical protein
MALHEVLRRQLEQLLSDESKYKKESIEVWKRIRVAAKAGKLWYKAAMVQSRFNRRWGGGSSLGRRLLSAKRSKAKWWESRAAVLRVRDRRVGEYIRDLHHETASLRRRLNRTTPPRVRRPPLVSSPLQ